MRCTFKKLLVALLCVAAMISCVSCGSMLEGETYVVSDHIDESLPEGPGRSFVEVENYDELYNTVCTFVRKHMENGYIHAVNYTGDVAQDVERACQSVYYDDPIGAYALYYISGSASRIVSYYEVEIVATYNRTLEQINGIIPVSSQRYLLAEILNMMRNYSEYAAFKTDIVDITKEELLSYIEQMYYSNPADIIEFPSAQISIFPESGKDRIIEIQLRYTQTNTALRYRQTLLGRRLQFLAGEVEAEDDAMVLLELCRLLMKNTEFDAATAADDSYTERDFVATSYGALVDGHAVGAGYAMGYKALCDEFGIECTVVKGRKNGVSHAWNIVTVNGEHYHVDVSACDTDGIETAFLLRDTDMTEYWWDISLYTPCAAILNIPISYRLRSL